MDQPYQRKNYENFGQSTCETWDADISIRDLTNLEPGDIIMLDRDATVPLEIFVEDVPKFRCIPGTLKGNRAVKITEVLSE